MFQSTVFRPTWIDLNCHIFKRLTPPLLSVPKRLMPEVMRPDRNMWFMGCLQIYPASRSRRDEPKRSPRLRERRTGSEPKGTLHFFRVVRAPTEGR